MRFGILFKAVVVLGKETSVSIDNVTGVTLSKTDSLLYYSLKPGRYKFLLCANEDVIYANDDVM